MAQTQTGKVVQVIGAVVDFEFYSQSLPGINNAIIVKDEARNINITCEVAEHIGEHIVRTVAMSATAGVGRGLGGIDTGASITLPVGPACLGRVFDLLGHPLDGQ